MKRELLRKSVHLIFLLAIPMSHVSVRMTQLILMVAGGCFFFSEQFRLNNRRIPFLTELERSVLRPSEEKNTAFAPITLMLGILLVLELYEPHIADVAIVAATVGDSMAAIFGKLVPLSKLWWNKKKSWGGMSANFVSVFLVGVFFLSPWQSLIAAAVSACVESLNLEHVDNLLVPLAVGVSLYLV